MIKGLLVQRIHAVSNSCAAVAIDEMNVLCKQVRIAHSRLRFPVLQDVGQVWLQLVISSFFKTRRAWMNMLR